MNRSDAGTIATTGLSHVRLTVTDIARSRAFYESVFGWPVYAEVPADADAATRERLSFLFGGVLFLMMYRNWYVAPERDAVHYRTLMGREDRIVYSDIVDYRMTEANGQPNLRIRASSGAKLALNPAMCDMSPLLAAIRVVSCGFSDRANTNTGRPSSRNRLHPENRLPSAAITPDAVGPASSTSALSVNERLSWRPINPSGCAGALTSLPQKSNRCRASADGAGGTKPERIGNTWLRSASRRQRANKASRRAGYCAERSVDCE